MSSGVQDSIRRGVLVLYVDDERSNRVVFEHSLSKQFSIITKGSAEEALEVLEREEVGVLVTDQRMPGISGNDLLAEAKQRWPDVVRIVITAYSDIEPILRAVNEGLVARYIVKPWEREELTALLEWACEVHLLGRRDAAVKQRLLRTERLAMIGSITSGAIHDLSQPMMALLNDTEALLRYARAVPAIGELLRAHGQSLSRHERQRLREVVAEFPGIASDLHEAASVASSITRRMHALGHGGEGDDEEPIADPLAIVRHALSISKSELPPGAEGSYVGPQPLPQVRIAPTDLFRVVLNLVMNSAQALRRRSERGGRVDVDARSDRDAVHIVVRDDGPGMSPTVVKKATKEFFTTRSDGTGLGLSQCRRLVEGAGGALGIESSEGDGTKVTVTLPRYNVIRGPQERRDAS